MSDVSNNGGKYGWRQSTLNTRCKPRNNEMLSSKELSPMALVMVYGPYQSGCFLWWGSNKALLLQMKPNFVTHLELVWHSMMIMALLVLSIGSFQYIMDLLADVLNALNEVVSPFSFGLHVSRVYPSCCKWYGHINGAYWLQFEPYLKGVVAYWAVESSIVAVLDIAETFIPCV